MDEITHRSLNRIVISISLTVLMMFVLSGCGIGEDDGEEDVNPTAEIEAEVTSPPVEATAPEDGVATSPPAESSPIQIDAVEAEPGEGSPTPDIVVSAPPIVVPTMIPDDIATPVQIDDVSPPAPTDEPTPADDTIIGDGTGGVPVAADAATPVAPAEGDITLVTGCDVGSYQAYQGDVAIQPTFIDTNLRAGPGFDCELVGESVGAGDTIEILSEPVAREGEDDSVWVAVSVDGAEGWLATRLLEPVAAD